MTEINYLAVNKRGEFLIFSSKPKRICLPIYENKDTGKEAYDEVVNEPMKANEYLSSYKEIFIYGFTKALEKINNK